jgi:hypothetical protein
MEEPVHAGFFSQFCDVAEVTIIMRWFSQISLHTRYESRKEPESFYILVYLLELIIKNWGIWWCSYDGFFPIFCCKNLVDFSLKITILVEFTLGVKLQKHICGNLQNLSIKQHWLVYLWSSCNISFFNFWWYEHVIRGRALRSVKAVRSLLRIVCWLSLFVYRFWVTMELSND